MNEPSGMVRISNWVILFIYIHSCIYFLFPLNAVPPAHFSTHRVSIVDHDLLINLVLLYFKLFYFFCIICLCDTIHILNEPMSAPAVDPKLYLYSLAEPIDLTDETLNYGLLSTQFILHIRIKCWSNSAQNTTKRYIHIFTNIIIYT